MLQQQQKPQAASICWYDLGECWTWAAADVYDGVVLPNAGTRQEWAVSDSDKDVLLLSSSLLRSGGQV